MCKPCTFPKSGPRASYIKYLVTHGEYSVTGPYRFMSSASVDDVSLGGFGWCAEELVTLNNHCVLKLPFG